MIVTNAKGDAKTVKKTERAPHTVGTAWIENGTLNCSMLVKFGLHYISGNSSPYFSITADLFETRGKVKRDVGGGCCHDLIAARFPGEFDDIIALHLSDMDGAPTHAAANGWYWLAAACGITRRWGPDNTPDECLAIFMRHCRIERQRAEDIVADIMAIEPVAHAVDPEFIREQHWNKVCETMRPRWKREATACIERLDLPVHGDVWPKPDALLVANGLAS